MAVHIDAVLPVHPLTITDLDRMVQVGIVSEDDHIELLDGVLVEMSPQNEAHMFAVRRFTALAIPVVAAAGMELSVQCPLAVRSSISQPEPDLAVIPMTSHDERPSGAVLVVEIAASSRAVDLGPKAAVYAAAGIPEYWVLDVDERRLVVHSDPIDGRYHDVRALGANEIANAQGLGLAVPVGALLGPAR